MRIMILALLKYLPHIYIFLAPNAWDTQVGRALFIPRIKVYASKLMNTFPSPTPATLAGSWRCPANKTLMTSVTMQNILIMIYESPNLRIAEIILSWPSFWYESYCLSNILSELFKG